MQVSRRDFMKLAATIGATAAMKLCKPEIMEVLAQAKDYWHIAWIQGQGCTGCTVSFANTVDPDVATLLTEILVGDSDLPIALPDFWPTLDPAAGSVSMRKLDRWARGSKGRRILVLEGSVPRDDVYCGVGYTPEGGEVGLREILRKYLPYADYVVAVGSCSSFGGIPSGKPNPTGSMSLQDFMKQIGINKPVMNLPGCPPADSWILLPLAYVIATGKLPALDRYGRPLAIYGRLQHEAGCFRRPYYDRGIFVEYPGQTDEGCLFKIGCKGPITHANCASERPWLRRSSPIHCGAPCVGCTEPTFPDGTMPWLKPVTELPSVLKIRTGDWAKALAVAGGIAIAADIVKRAVSR